MTLTARVRPVVTLVAAVATSLGGLTVLAGPADAAVATTITAKTSASVTRSAPSKVTGTVRPGKPTRTVTLQRYAKKKWSNAATGHTNKRTGTYAVAVPTKVIGVTTYRVAVPAAHGVRARATAAFRVTVTAKPAKTTIPVIVPVIVPVPVPVPGPVPVPAFGNPMAYTFLQTAADGTPARWNPCTPISYRVNASLASAGALADAQEAIARVAGASGLTFLYKGATTAIPSGGSQGPTDDAALIIAWVTPGTTSHLSQAETEGGTAGKGGGSWSGGYHNQTGNPTLLITSGFVVLDAKSALEPGFGPGPDYGLQGSRGQALMHEIGHAVGLGHPTIEDSSEIMSGTMTHKDATWGAGDLTGLRLVGATNGCLTR